MLAYDRFRRLALGFAAVSLTASLLLMATDAQGGAARPKQTLTGAAARSSPQADVFIAYEQALLDGGLETADKCMAPAQREEVKQELQRRYPAAGAVGPSGPAPLLATLSGETP